MAAEKLAKKGGCSRDHGEGKSEIEKEGKRKKRRGYKKKRGEGVFLRVFLGKKRGEGKEKGKREVFREEESRDSSWRTDECF